MFRYCKTTLVLATIASIALPGCSTSRSQVGEVSEAIDTDDRSPYDSIGLHPEQPNVCVEDEFASALTAQPITINDEEPPAYWEMSLEEAVHLSLSNSRIMRDLGATVLKLPTSTKTIHDPSIMESDPRFGVEAALSHFDAHFATSGFFEKNDRALNNVFFGGGTRILEQDGNVYQTALTKKTATGAELSIRNNTDYDSNNAPGNAFYSSWNTNIEAQVKQPLLAFGGVEYNRVYGPNGIPGLPAGVMLARVNTEGSLTDFEVGARNFISDVENAYWDLYYAYRELDAKVEARDEALDTWRQIKGWQKAGRTGGDEVQEAQAREQYYRFQEEVQNAITGRLQDGTHTNNGSSGGSFRGAGGVQVAERRLRLMMGVHISDGKLIRPADEPKMARAVFDWDVILAEALTRRPELRKQKWLVKRREMELSATKNLLLPRLDATGRYRWRGFGKDLLPGGNPNIGAPPVGLTSNFDQYQNAWDNLFTGNFQEWQLGFEFEVPLGFRHAHNAVRNYELQLMRERAILNEQEREVVLDLSNSIAELERAYSVLQTNHNRRIAAKQQLAALEQKWSRERETTPQTLYLKLEAQRRLADAEVQFYRVLVEYELAIKNVHFEKGSLLEYNGVLLAELPWPDKAYQDAFEKVKLRSRASRLAEAIVDGPDEIVSDDLMPQSYAVPGDALPLPAVNPRPKRGPGDKVPPAPAAPQDDDQDMAARPADRHARRDRPLPPPTAEPSDASADEFDETGSDDGAAGGYEDTGTDESPTGDAVEADVDVIAPGFAVPPPEAGEGGFEEPLDDDMPGELLEGEFEPVVGE